MSERKTVENRRPFQQQIFGVLPCTDEDYVIVSQADDGLLWWHDKENDTVELNDFILEKVIGWALRYEFEGYAVEGTPITSGPRNNYHPQIDVREQQGLVVRTPRNMSLEDRVIWVEEWIKENRVARPSTFAEQEANKAAFKKIFLREA